MARPLRLLALPVAVALLSAACSTLLGADFDRAEPLPDAGATSGGSGNTGGSIGGGSGAPPGGQGGLAGAAAAGGAIGGAAGNMAGSGGAGGTGGAATGGWNGGGTAGTAGAAGSGGFAGTAAAGGMAGAAGTPAFSVVINEVNGDSPDYIELVNNGTEPVDIGGHAVADESGGLPKLSEAYRFPSGTVLAPGERVLIITGERTEPGAKTDDCGDYPAPCYHATFGISNSGELIFLLDAGLPSGVVDQVAYPGGVAWGRLPDGTGDFQVLTASPNALNE